MALLYVILNVGVCCPVISASWIIISGMFCNYFMRKRKRININTVNLLTPIPHRISLIGFTSFGLPDGRYRLDCIILKVRGCWKSLGTTLIDTVVRVRIHDYLPSSYLEVNCMQISIMHV